MRRTKRSYAAIVSLAVAVSPLLWTIGSRAQAASTWELARQITSERNEIEDFDFAVGTGGTAAIAWAVPKKVPENSGYLYGTTSYIRVSVRGPSESVWSSPQTISVTAEDAHNPDVAVAPDGDVVVVWGSSYVVGSITENGDTFAKYEPRVRAAFKPGSGVFFESAETIESTGDYAYGNTSYVVEPAVAFDPSGNATALWDRFDSDRYSYEMRTATLRTASSDFGFPSRVATCATASLPAVVTDAAGNITAAWACTKENDSKSIDYTTAPAGESFRSTSSISLSQEDYPTELVVDMDPTGRAVAAWTSYGFNGGFVDAAVMSDGRSFGSRQRLSSTADDFMYEVDAAVASNGEAIVAWSSGVSTYSSKAADLAAGATSFGSTYSLGDGFTSVEFGSDGTAYAAWSTTGFAIEVAERAPGSMSWGSGTRISGGYPGAFAELGVGGLEGGSPNVAWFTETDQLAVNRARTPYNPAGKQPVILIPGILGTEIVCEKNDVLWPDALFKDGDLLQTRLAPDGRSPFDPRDKCNRTARPRNILRSIYAVEDIYSGAENFLRTLPGMYPYSFPYDWRKSPKYSLGRLDALVDKALNESGAEKVVIMAHSMGGLVTQAYIKDQAHADKVGRVVTIGTPYWGAVKAWNIVMHGLESQLGRLYEKSTIKKATRNMSGVFTLFPSRNLTTALGGSWLARGSSNRTFDQAIAALGDADGNTGLFRQAAAYHASVLDGFDTNGVEYHIIVGTGKATIVGVNENQSGVRLSDRLGNGDGTVPVESQLQAQWASKPMGDDVGVHYVCGISHTEEPNSDVVHDMIRNYLISGVAIENGEACATWEEDD